MPAFGGPDLSTLFITSIGGGGSHGRDPAEPEAGDLFVLETQYQGLPEPRFAGPVVAGEHASP
jgi:L-arabinonolactonase